jgi:apolipoprotein D and lipocalin family protein
MSHRQSSGLLLPALLAAGTAAFLVGRTARPAGNRRVPEPAKSVDLQRYLGLWHELGRYDVGFERDCEGVTAEYTLRDEGVIQVLNTCRKGAPDGPKRSVRGKRARELGYDTDMIRPTRQPPA